MATDLERIHEIERITGIPLKQVPFEKIGEKEKFGTPWMGYLNANRAFSLDGNNNVTGLSLDYYPVYLLGDQVLRSFTHVSFLSFSNSWLPAYTFLKELKGLTSLDLSYNNLSDVSVLKELKGLTSLDLRSNNLSDVSVLKELKGLTSLYLSSNNLSDVSVLKELKGLRYLGIEGNPITNPPKEVIEKGLNGIKAYFEQEEKYGKDLVFEAKLLLVGEPGAGKTTLMNKLFNPFHPVPDHAQTSTLGVTVRPGLVYTHPAETNISITTNVWDFGGQMEQYMLHQFFLTPDSLYVLVSDVRREDTRYDYWFQIIQLLAGKNLPVIVVLNRNKINTAVHFPKELLLKNFPGITIREMEVDFVVNDKRWELLLETIVSELSKLPVVGMEVPKPWKPIREELETLRERKYIPIEDYFRICERNGIKDDKDQLFLLGYFHRIGVALHFSGDERLQNKVYLDPNWITNGIYEALSEQVLKEKKGEFKKEWLFERLRDKGYTFPERGDILNLMLRDKFEICYDLKDVPGSYIVPLALPDVVLAYPWDALENLQFRFQYPFMPEGIISRLIVKLHAFIENNFVWKKGVVLQRKGCRAEIVQTQSIDEGLKYIGIRVAGGTPDDRKSLLLLIRHEVENIHRTAFPGMICSEMVVCNCSECSKSDRPSFYKNEDIANFILKNRRTIQCRVSAEDVPIRDLVGAVYYEEETGMITGDRMFDNQKVDSRSEIGMILKEFKDEMDEPEKDHSQKPLCPKKVFFSYAHTDRNYRDEFEQHFAQIKREGLVETWFDGKIEPGKNWDDEIAGNLQKADIILLMLSPRFMNSKYIWEKEIQTALTRIGKARIIPIFLIPVDFAGPPLAGLQGIPRDDAGTMQWIAVEEHQPKRDLLYLEVIRELRKII